MKSYRRLQILAVAALLFEMIVGMGGELTAQREFFPFTSWFLFTRVPYRATEFEVVLRAQGGRALDPPRPFNRAVGLVTQPHSIGIHELIQQFGRAEEARADGSQLLRRRVESQFTVPAVRYDLVRVKYLPVERWTTGRVEETHVVRSYESGKP